VAIRIGDLSLRPGCPALAGCFAEVQDLDAAPSWRERGVALAELCIDTYASPIAAHAIEQARALSGLPTIAVKGGLCGLFSPLPTALPPLPYLICRTNIGVFPGETTKLL
jgi:hypothetical protein